MKLKECAKRLKKKIPVVYLCWKDKDTPWYAKAFAGICVAYALSPIDLIPDFIPVLGYLDDMIVVPFLAFVAIKLIPKQVWLNNEQKAMHLWEKGKPKQWRYAIVIVVGWLCIIGICFKIML